MSIENQQKGNFGATNINVQNLTLYFRLLYFFRTFNLLIMIHYVLFQEIYNIMQAKMVEDGECDLPYFQIAKGFKPF